MATAAPAGNPRGAPGRHVDPEPRVVHAGDNDHNRTEDDLGEEEVSSLHPSRGRAASSLGRPAPSPATALLMAHELLQYRPTPGAHDAWLNRLTELVGDARVPSPAPSRSLVRSARAGSIAHGASPPPSRAAPAAAPPQPAPVKAPAPAGAPPRDNRAASRASSPHDCQVVQRAPPDARVDIERQRDRYNRAVHDVAAAGRQLRTTLTNGVVAYGTTSAFTRSLRRVVWPPKFKPILPPRYDGKNSPLGFLQLYTLAIQAAGGDDRVMANWFPMALKDSASSWLTNLPAESIDTW